MTYSTSAQLAPRAFLAILLLVASVGCDSPAASSVTSSEGAQGPATAASAATAVEAPQVQQPPDQQTTRPADPTAQRVDDAVAGDLADTTADKSGAVGGMHLRGRVVFDGPKPERRAIVMTKDATCIKLHGDQPVLSEELIINDDGGVRNVFVYIRRGAPKIDYPVPDQVVELDQKDCMYRPRVQGMMVGQTLRVLNNDPVTHNVRSFPVRNRAFNFGQPADSGPRERLFDSPEREIEIQCDIHPWMHAYLFVMEHPYFAVTDEGGSYSIAGLPPGDYSLAIWHEELGRQQRDVKLVDRDVDDVTFTFQP
ncbi:MAG: carboxypeptidase regulatory-like domain-containing protein [Pirellulales bacterium]